MYTKFKARIVKIGGSIGIIIPPIEKSGEYYKEGVKVWVSLNKIEPEEEANKE